MTCTVAKLKKSIYIIFFILSMFSTPYCKAQITEIKEIKTDAESFRIDKLGNYYLIKGNSVTKTNYKFEKIAVYDTRSYGDITDIDVSNPFRTLIYYKDFNTLIFLDNYFSELRAPILLDDLNVFNIEQVCYSYIGSFRIFDNHNCRVELYDKDLNIIQTGINLYSVINNQRAIKIRESSNYVCVLFESGQIILLDKFGNFYKEIPHKDIEDFEFDNDNLFLLSDNKIITYECEDSKTRTINLEENIDKISNFSIFEGHLYTLSNKKIKVYKIQD